MTPEAALARWGLLLLSDARYPSLASVIAGAPVRGSWWGHPKGRAIFNASCALERDAEAPKLVNGKVTFVHRRLWPALAGAGLGPRVVEVHRLWL